MKNITQKVSKVVGLIALTGLSHFSNAQFNWSSAGPVYTAGRARNMIVDKNDPSGKTLYLGSSTSGIFKSTDGGANWAPLNDQGTIRNISYMAQGADGTIWATTGEGFLRYGQKAKAQRGTGLYKLNGTNLQQIKDSLAVGAVINRIACHPINNTHIALATNKGIMVSTDGGGSFNVVTLPGFVTKTDSTYGMDVKFDGNGILYCTIGNERGGAFASFNKIASKVFKSADASLGSFVNITPVSSILPDQNYGRIELAIAPTNNNVIYASCANKNTSFPGKTQVINSASLKGLFVSYDAGATWGLIIAGSPQLDPLSNGGTISSGDYAHVLQVSPSSENELFMGGYSFYYYVRAGGTNASPIGNWYQLGYSQQFVQNTPFYLHENLHDIKIVPGNPVKFYFITDAGVYRSIDLVNSSQSGPPTYQPFYKGLITGQFNSVSIERFPITSTSTPVIEPYTGFIGGTGANGFNYYSGKGSSVVTKEVSYLSGDVYNAEYSKILNGTAILTTGNGDLYRSADVKTSPPTKMNLNKYSKKLSAVAPEAGDFYNSDINTGTQFRLWENYGQYSGNSPDKAFFYNDSLRFQYSFNAGVAGMIAQTSFSFSAARPNRKAYIDSIVVRTATVSIPISDPTLTNSPTFTEGRDITIKLPDTYTPATSSVTTLTVSTNVTGPIQGAATVALNPTTLQDLISVTFTAPPFATRTATIRATSQATVTDPSSYYRVFATVFYRYDKDDTVSVNDANISNKFITYKKVLPNNLRWKYGSFPSATLAITNNTAITNPTFALTTGTNQAVINSTSSTVTLNPIVQTNYTVTQYGVHTITATPVTHTLVAISNTAITSPTYVLNPGGVVQTGTNVTFVVTPTAATTDYTITQSGTGTLTSDTYSTVGGSTYVLTPGAVTQTTTIFTVTTTPTSVNAYTIDGTSSNTVTGKNTIFTYTAPVPSYTVNVGTNTNVPFPSANAPFKIQTSQSARLAMILTNANVTSDGLSNTAVVVSKNALNLNDPLNVVRVSQHGCMTDDANGVATTNTIAISGKPTILEWSKAGTEIYYATSTNKLYRVSHITDIMDLSSSSYAGKFYTDVWEYTSTNSASKLNLSSPYRTTLVGSFDYPITSISVSKDDKSVVLTFNNPNPSPTGSTSIVMMNSGDITKGNSTSLTWNKKDDAGSPIRGNVTYCSLIENTQGGVFVGTDNGLFFTSNIAATPATWIKVNNNELPNVQIFDIKQQTMEPHNCYNSGQIYVATNGRGIWTNSKYFTVPYVVGTEEYIEKEKAENNLAIYPNPTNGNTTLAFDAVDGEKASINIMDLSGRVVMSENMGKLNYGSIEYTFDTNSLTPGIYIVAINGSSNVKRVCKLVVSK